MDAKTRAKQSFLCCVCVIIPCSLTASPGEKTFEVKIASPTEQFARIWIQVLDRRDGSFLVRYRMYASYTDLHVSVLLKDEHVAKSPFILPGRPSIILCALGGGG